MSAGHLELQDKLETAKGSKSMTSKVSGPSPSTNFKGWYLFAVLLPKFQSQGSPESGILVSSGGCRHAESIHQTSPIPKE